MIKSYCNSALKSRVRCAARVRHTDGEAENSASYAQNGGDEFLLVLSGIPADYFKVKLEQIRAREKNTDMLVGVLSQIVEFRNGECGAFNPLLLQCLLNVQGELKQEILQW